MRQPGAGAGREHRAVGDRGLPLSVTAAAGFVAAGVHCGIKEDAEALDLALVATDPVHPVTAAGVFTSNRAPAAPVQVTRAHLAATGNRAAAVVLNSGNANAATGGGGRGEAERTCALVAEGLGCGAEEVLVCSTGLIGIPLPMDVVAGGIEPLVSSRDAGTAAARAAAQAICTTDTVVKEVVVEGPGFTVGGMAKGAAMLAPDMATMLAVLTTDAFVDAGDLRRDLQVAVDGSFNALSVDGCTSTNDTVLVLASGLARGHEPTDPVELERALAAACLDLAAQMADDAEGATKVATVRVGGARSVDDARRAARKVAESQLVKCSLYGADPYWGRIVSELGSSGAAFDPDRVTVAYGGVLVCAGGIAVVHDRAAVAAHLARPAVEIAIDLGLGDAEAAILTNDLTPGYIAENMRTS
ncbi:MAG TPA: bifunctional glutamate N-acetyltransferase/amino-acid acetyltransferase ArgJ [Acidimicrobiales bacterium]|nr:bifunctional glutamate N-acetyltransferase/amino-acid acetyltransferase ArgJ [Acidimicrobiales bacterium]